MANTELVPHSYEHVNTIPFSVQGHQEQSVPATQTLPQAPTMQQPLSYGGTTVRQVLASHRLSKKAQELVLASWRSSTRTRYDGVLKKWEEFCSKGNKDPFYTTIGDVLNFMAERFDEGVGYSSVAALRSALNPLVTIKEGGELTSHPLVQRLVKGVFHARPPLPRYTEVWDVGLVITFIRDLGTNSSLTRRQLTLKVTALLSILTVQRVSSITNLSYKETHVEKDRVVLVPTSLAKHDRQSRKIETITIRAYPRDDRLCIVETLKAYKALPRPSETKSGPLILTHKKPYHPPKTDTVAGWLKEVLCHSGVDMTRYKAHSYRGASTSAAKTTIPLTEILKRGQWSSEETWRRHYDLPVEGYTETEDFSARLLDRYASR